MRPIAALGRLSQQNKRTAIAAAFFTMVSLLLALLFAQISNPSTKNYRDRDISRPSDFVITGVSVLENHGDGIDYRSSATSIRSTNRSGAGGLIVYHDIGEIIATNVMIEAKADQKKGTPLASVFNAATSFFSVNARNSELMLTSQPEPMLTTRIRIEKFSMRLHGSNGMDLSLHGLKARLIFDPEVLVLEGQVVINRSPDQEVRSLRAVFSKAFDGVYFPEGYTVGDRRYGKSVFMVLTGDGKFVETPMADQIDYDDLIGKMEKLVFSQLLRALPKGIRPLMGTMLGNPSEVWK